MSVCADCQHEHDSIPTGDLCLTCIADQCGQKECDRITKIRFPSNQSLRTVIRFLNNRINDLRQGHKLNADEDYRGNRPRESVRSFQCVEKDDKALKEFNCG